MTFKRCRLRWHFSSPLRLNLAPIKTVPPLMFGSAVHAALESYYNPNEMRNPERAVASFVSFLNEWYTGLRAPSVEDDELYDESMLLGTGMLEHYFMYQAPQDDFEVLAVELPFEVPIEGTDRMYAGKIDGVIRDKHGRVWVLEHKTADRILDNTEYLLMDEQCGSYLWALRQLPEFAGEHIEGVLYNILRKKIPTPMAELKNGGLSTDKRTDTTFQYASSQIRQYYEGTIPNRYVAYLEMLQQKGNRFFYREPVRRNEREIEYLGKMIALEASEMTNPDIAIYRNPTSGNCNYCSFVGPCLALYGGDDYQTMLDTNYEQSTHDDRVGA